mmetsp:Transcript_93941/g.163147  ORF Transcript_93941/g.163147 Transcript_93941/m.163147 type:complete len:388 (+) Transcript_93941:78-1241(+)
MAQRWEVVGGADKGGILVRAGLATSSEQLKDRLSTGAIVEELELNGERLNYKKISGTGPETGWVSIALKDKVLLEKRETPAAGAKAAPAAKATPKAAAAPPAEAGPWSVKKGDYYVTLGVIFKKPGDDPETQKMLKLTRKVGSIVHTTSKVWKAPKGGFWVELDVSNGDSGAGEKPGYVMIDAAGFGTPGPCLQIANEPDGPPVILTVKKPKGAEAWDKIDEDKQFVTLKKTPISEVKAVLGMLFGMNAAALTVFGPKGAALTDDSTIEAAGFETGAEVKFESSEKSLTLICMTPLEDYEGQKMCDLPVKDTWSMGQVKTLLCKITGLNARQMIMAKGKMGERVGEDAKLDEKTTVKDVGYKDGDEIGFIYMGNLEEDVMAFLKTKK